MRVATIDVAIDVGVSYTSVAPLPDPLRAIGGLFSVVLSVALRRLAVSQHPVLWSSDFPLGSQPSDHLSPPRCYRWDSNPHALAGTTLSTLRVCHSTTIAYHDSFFFSLIET